MTVHEAICASSDLSTLQAVVMLAGGDAHFVSPHEGATPHLKVLAFSEDGTPISYIIRQDRDGFTISDHHNKPGEIWWEYAKEETLTHPDIRKSK